MPVDGLQILPLWCEFPARLHPASRVFLENFLDGRLSAAEFQRFFSLPNSDYIPLAECIVRLLACRDGFANRRGGCGGRVTRP